MDKIVLNSEELSDGDLQWLAAVSEAPVMVSYSMDVHVTVDGHTVMADDVYQCTYCGEKTKPAFLWEDGCEEEEDGKHDWFHDRKLDKYNVVRWTREDWSTVEDGEYFVPTEMQGIAAQTLDVSDPDVDEWCGEYITQTVSFNAVGGQDVKDALAEYYESYGGIWTKYGIHRNLCDTMGILSADGIWPAKSVEHMEEGWDGYGVTPVFAGSLYISDPRLFIQVV